MYQDRLLALPWRPPAADPNTFFEPPPGIAKLVADAVMVTTKGQAARWTRYSGPYRMPAWGYLDLKGAPDRFLVAAGVPYFETDDNAEAPIRHRLAEVEPGLFVADNGETLDLRGRIMTWRNLPLVRVSGGPSRWQWAILGAAALVAGAWLVAALARSVRRLTGSRSSSGPRAWTSRRRRVAALVASATALLALGNVGLLAWIPGLVDSGFLGALDLSLAQRLAVRLPLAVTVLAALMAVLAAWGCIGRWWSRAVTLQYAALAVATIALVPLLAGWHLIG